MAISADDMSIIYVKRHITFFRDKQNYEKWSEDMKVEFKKLNCWKLVIGLLKEPQCARTAIMTDSEYDEAI